MNDLDLTPTSAIEVLAWVLDNRDRIRVPKMLPPNTVQLDWRDLRTLDMSPEVMGVTMELLACSWRSNPCSVPATLQGHRQLLATCHDPDAAEAGVREVWMEHADRLWFWPAAVQTLSYAAERLSKALGGKLGRAKDPVATATPVLEALLRIGVDDEALRPKPDKPRARAAFDTALAAARASVRVEAIRPAPEPPPTSTPSPPGATPEPTPTIASTPPVDVAPVASDPNTAALAEIAANLSALVANLPESMRLAFSDLMVATKPPSADHMVPKSDHMVGKSDHMVRDSDHMDTITLSYLPLPSSEAAAASEASRVVPFPSRGTGGAGGGPSTAVAVALNDHPDPWPEEHAERVRQTVAELEPVVGSIFGKSSLCDVDRQTVAHWCEKDIPAEFARSFVLSRCTTTDRNGQRRLFVPDHKKSGKPIHTLKYWRAACVEEWELVRQLQAPAEFAASAPEIDIRARLAILASHLPEDLADRDAWLARVAGLEGNVDQVEAALGRLDADLLGLCETTAEVEDKLKASRRTLADRLPPAALEEALERLRRRLIREAAGLPALSLFAPEAVSHG